MLLQGQRWQLYFLRQRPHPGHLLPPHHRHQLGQLLPVKERLRLRQLLLLKSVSVLDIFCLSKSVSALDSFCLSIGLSVLDNSTDGGAWDCRCRRMGLTRCLRRFRLHYIGLSGRSVLNASPKFSIDTFVNRLMLSCKTTVCLVTVDCATTNHVLCLS